MDILLLSVVLMAGALAGFLAGLLGVGGGMVIVPVLVYVYASSGFPIDAIMQFSLATSLASIFFTGLSSARAHHARGAVRWDIVRLMAIPLVFGAFAGAWLADALGSAWLMSLFGIFAVLIAARMWFARDNHAKTSADTHEIESKNLTELPSPELPTHRSDCEENGSRHVVAGGVIGVASAVFGIGGGSLTVPWLHRSGLRMQNAVATSAACGVPIALAAAAGYMVVGQMRNDLPAMTLGYVHLPSLLLLVIASTPMAALGAHAAHRLPAGTLRRVFAAMLLLVALDFLMR